MRINTIAIAAAVLVLACVTAVGAVHHKVPTRKPSGMQACFDSADRYYTREAYR